jgi:hypothetical protein
MVRRAKRLPIGHNGAVLAGGKGRWVADMAGALVSCAWHRDALMQSIHPTLHVDQIHRSGRSHVSAALRVGRAATRGIGPADGRSGPRRWPHPRAGTPRSICLADHIQRANELDRSAAPAHRPAGDNEHGCGRAMADPITTETRPEVSRVSRLSIVARVRAEARRFAQLLVSTRWTRIVARWGWIASACLTPTLLLTLSERR